MSYNHCKRIEINNNLINGPGLTPQPWPTPTPEPPVPSICGKVYVANQLGNSVSVMDTVTGQVITTIDLNGSPLYISYDSNTNRIFVSLVYINELVIIDPDTDTITDQIQVNVTTLSEVLFNSSLNLYYVVSQGSNEIVIYDGTTFEEVGRVNVPVPVYLAIDNNTGLIYAPATRSNYVSVINGSTEIAQIIVGAAGINPVEIALNSTTRRAYVSLRGNNSVAVIDTVTNTLITTITVQGSPFGIDINPVTNKVYVTLTNGEFVEIDGLTNTVTNRIQVSNYSRAVVVDDERNIAYVANSNENTVSTIDLTTFSVIQTTEVGSSPRRLALYHYEC
ncbi:YncE family protein [Geomicrobium sediminis]|uniref:YVTN family beta-propeller protein n=1 Tax=Geomicrobium sediminis TaxID=1347788 RepID=A0ABS2PF43_9BACL|nr:YncE family protein [Geomicrobium sediminis]MBM7633882.1 YVTN family beta-propeller protein [Geomicrobium sediminis]